MSKNKNAYTQLCDEIAEKIAASNRAKGRNSSAVSKSDLEMMTTTLLNTPDHTVTVYPYSSKDTEDPIGVEKQPVKRYRDSLKPMLRNMGMDKYDVDRIDDVPMTKEHAAALLDVATVAVHDYMRAGRKFSFPMMEKDETRMEMQTITAPEKISQGNRFMKDDAAANDRVTVTKERVMLKAKNPVPSWLKKTSK